MGLLTAIREFYRIPTETRSLTPNQAWARDIDWGSTESGVRVDQNNATALATVYACTSLIADLVSTLPVDTYTKRGGYPVEFRPRPEWLDAPVPNDPSITRSVHFAQVTLSLLFDGNAFLLCTPNVEGAEVVEVLDPRRVTIKVDGENGRPQYHVTGSSAGQSVKYDSLRVQHIPRAARPGRSRAPSPIDETAETLGVALAAQRHSGRFYRNSALLSTILEVPGEMSEEDALKLRDNFEAAHSGRNAFRTGVLTAGAKATTLGVTPEQAQFLETTRFHVVEVCRIFRVPPMLVGVNEPGAVSYASSQEAVKAFHTNTLAPLLTLLQQGYRRLMPRDDVYLQFDTKGLLRADAEARFNAYAIAVEKGVFNRNEVRGWEELAPIPGDGGEVYTVQGQMVDLNTITEEPEEEPVPEQEPEEEGPNAVPNEEGQPLPGE